MSGDGNRKRPAAPVDPGDDSEVVHLRARVAALEARLASAGLALPDDLGDPSVLAVVDNLTAVYIAAMLFGLGYGGILPCYPVIVREYLPASEVGRRTAIVILFAGGGMALGAWLGGAIFDLTGSYKMAFLIGAAFNLANLAIIGSLIARTRIRPALA